jgi:hypothetical protein
MLLSTILLTIALILVSCATTKKAIFEEDFYKHWIGTWVNTDLRGCIFRPHKIICHADGEIDAYYVITDAKNTDTREFTLIDSWKDTEGNIYYQATEIYPGLPKPAQVLGKISALNNTSEKIFYFEPEPIEEWDPNNPRCIYVLYYRQ